MLHPRYSRLSLNSARLWLQRERCRIQLKELESEIGGPDSKKRFKRHHPLKNNPDIHPAMSRTPRNLWVLENHWKPNQATHNAENGMKKRIPRYTYSIPREYENDKISWKTTADTRNKEMIKQTKSKS